MSIDPPVLTGLFVYPIKGAGGVRVRSWEVDEFGLALDRRWMVIDSEGEFRTQRNSARLALIRPTIERHEILLEGRGHSALRIARAPDRGEALPVTVWSSTVTAWAVSREADSWFSDFLGMAVRLVHMPRDTYRPTDLDVAPGHRVSFADAYSFLLCSEASLEDLNKRLLNPVPMNRFRPNLVVSGVGAHDEDGWRRIRIRDLALSVVKPCARCVVTTVDQESGIKGKEPLRTLTTYRGRDGRVFFGMNLVHREQGRLAEGDPIEVLEAH